MRAYYMKSPGDPVKTVRIVKGNEVIKDQNNNVMEKINGPIGGVDILPSTERPPEFVPFKLDDGSMISNEAEMRKAYDEMYGVKTAVSEVEKPKEIEKVQEPKPRGRPAKPVVDEDDDA